MHRAHTDPELFAQWMGPRGTTVRIDRFDARTGGAFRYVVQSADGGNWAFRGSYHSVTEDSIVHTWEYEDEAGVTLEDMLFTDTLEGCVVDATSTYTSKQACDEMLESGLDAGMDSNFDRLDELLARLQTEG